MDERDGSHWVGTWATVPVPVDGIALAGQTLRMISRISIGGSRVRVRVSNAWGRATLLSARRTWGCEARGRASLARAVR
jgi:hypothetical protein